MRREEVVEQRNISRRERAEGRHKLGILKYGG